MEDASMSRWLFLLSSMLVPAVAGAAIETQTVEYQHGEARLVGYLAYPKEAKGPLPGVLVVHEWMGLNDYAKRRVEQLAELGYVAFAADIYGEGRIAVDIEEARQLSGTYKGDRPLFRARVAAGLETLKAQPSVDPARVAAIGYCFGGTAVLELARGGAEVAGVVSFHGGLDSPTPEDAKNIRAKVLVLHGADDPLVPPAEVLAFEEEMRQGGVDWQLISYGGAVHGFTNPASGDDPSGRGVAYNAVADARSWAAMRQFFAELFEER
jgi:dienelactone hydrolase